jgi:serine/threonine protein kinase
MKVFEKSKLRTDLLRQRVDIELFNHGKMTHPNIARMFEVMESSRRIYMIMEYAPKGDLHRYVRKCRRLNDEEARGFFADIAKVRQLPCYGCILDIAHLLT